MRRTLFFFLALLLVVLSFGAQAEEELLSENVDLVVPEEEVVELAEEELLSENVDLVVPEEELLSENVDLVVPEEEVVELAGETPVGTSEEVMAAGVPKAGNADFEIVDGVLVKYNGPGGEVAIPSTVKKIGKRAFFRCDTLTGVTIPESVTEIEDGDGYFCYGDSDCCGAFAYCANLERVTFNKGLKEIGFQAFYGCGKLESVEIPKGVTLIDRDAFGACTGLKSATIPTTLEWWSGFQGCTCLKDFVIPKGIKRIGFNAFQNSGLEHITIPDGVTSVGDFAFGGCKNLKHIDLPDSITDFEPYTFLGSGLESVTVPKGVTSLSCWEFEGCPNLKQVILQEGFDYLDPSSFLGSNALTCIVMPRSLTSFNEWEEWTSKQLTIYGYSGSAAEEYAKKKGIPFVALGSLAGAKITVKDQAYTGKVLKPAVTVKLGKNTLKQGTDYTVEYANNQKIGKATVTVTGIGKYWNTTATTTFRINPKKVSGLKLKAGERKLTITWKKVKGADGYQIEYGLKKNFKGAKKLKVAGGKKSKATLSKLKAAKKYYVRIRSYKKVGKETYYSAWTSTGKKTK